MRPSGVPVRHFVSDRGIVSSVRPNLIILDPTGPYGVRREGGLGQVLGQVRTRVRALLRCVVREEQTGAATKHVRTTDQHVRTCVVFVFSSDGWQGKNQIRFLAIRCSR